MMHQLPLQTTVQLGAYLFTRLNQLGVESVFGVPGDYNLHLLDYIEISGLHWVGNCNELNAAYAADGYSRINGLGALITTFGVGELSAINGIAGAYCEKAPIIHIVGSPSRNLQESHARMHHTFADGDYQKFTAMHSHVTVAQLNLIDPRTATNQLDWILVQALIHSRPVYIEIPEDMVDINVSASSLLTKLSVPAFLPWSKNLPKTSIISERMRLAQRPMILVDGEIRSRDILKHIEILIKCTGWPTWTTPFGKGLVNEQLENVHGCYMGKYGKEDEKLYFESADLVFHFGPHNSDTNTQGFTTVPNRATCISFSNTGIQIGADFYHDIPLQEILTRLIEAFNSTIPRSTAGPKKEPMPRYSFNSQDEITQMGFYHAVGPFFRAGDVILTETGTASHGGRTFVLPPDTRYFGAATWLSIGYMLPATLGAALAQRQHAGRNGESMGHLSPNPRAILFIGDGSLQMTVQELSTIIREDLDVIIFIINNGGYTIERAIHGRNRSYNDITSWQHQQALSFFGADVGHASANTFTSKTWGDLEAVLKSNQLERGTGVRIVEVFMGKEDCQSSLKELLQRQIAKSTTV